MARKGRYYPMFFVIIIWKMNDCQLFVSSPSLRTRVTYFRVAGQIISGSSCHQMSTICYVLFLVEFCFFVLGFLRKVSTIFQRDVSRRLHFLRVSIGRF